jgi:hypothetical protein
MANIWFLSPWGIGRLLIEGLAVANAAPEEMRQIGNFGERVGLFSHEAPEGGGKIHFECNAASLIRAATSFGLET